MNQSQIRLSIAEKFTTTPGSRHIEEGEFSGEEFLNKVLIPAYNEAVESKHILMIDLDNTEGYATSFLEEAFGGLARKFGHEEVLKHLEFKSFDEPLLIEEIKRYIEDAQKS